ncbi:MAG: NAD-binding protein [Gammaproteobacteria bacterium]
MNLVTAMILRRMRRPFIMLITVYNIAILGMILIPGVDDQGNPWHMSIFHAFYFVSYTATTIGFGEIPYPLSDAQRLWVVFSIYILVIAWLYAIGKILTLIQDPHFKAAVTSSRFRKRVNSINEPFYLVCGLGETGYEVVTALTEEHYRAVVIENNPDNLNEIRLYDMREYVPNIIGDASDAVQLESAGIKRANCKGVIALTATDDINLKIAITSKLLHPNVKVVCRSELKEYEENMLSFGTDHVVNPFETFATMFEMLMHSPSLHLIYDWLTGVPNTRLSDPVYFRYGHWILCGYGRFGKELYKLLIEHDIAVTVIDPSVDVRDEFEHHHVDYKKNFILGTGIDEKTLRQAGVDKSAGIIAGSDNDSNNLSIIMTARAINPDLFVVARQNIYNNYDLYTATRANLIMRPREITARKIRAVFLNPLLVDYLQLANNFDEEWANITISRLSAVVGSHKPHIWTVEITDSSSPAVAEALELGRFINLGHITQDPASRYLKLKCVPLLHVRGVEKTMMPSEDMDIKYADRLLFCGTREIKNSMDWTLRVMSSLNYVMTFKNEPESFVWRLLHRYMHKTERRKLPR